MEEKILQRLTIANLAEVRPRVQVPSVAPSLHDRPTSLRQCVTYLTRKGVSHQKSTAITIAPHVDESVPIQTLLGEGLNELTH